MIVEERMRTYINSLDMGNTPFLEELEKEHFRKGSHYPQGNAELSENVSCSNPADENTGGRNGSRFFHSADVRIWT